MDPEANVSEQYRILSSRRPDLDRLGELVEALDNWLAAGGFCPSTPAEMRALRSDAIVAIRRGVVGVDDALSDDAY